MSALARSFSVVTNSGWVDSRVLLGTSFGVGTGEESLTGAGVGVAIGVPSGMGAATW